MGFQDVGSSKGCQVGARQLRNVRAPEKRRASISPYQVALIREPHRPAKGQLIVCARSLRNGPSDGTESCEFNPPLHPLFKQSTELLGLGRKKVLEGDCTLQKATGLMGHQEAHSWATNFCSTSTAALQGRRLSPVRRSLS